MEINQILEQHSQLLLWTSLILTYILYLACTRYFTVRMAGDYDLRKKNLGRSLPPFPNGWYIACKSKDLPKNTTKPIDMAG